MCIFSGSSIFHFWGLPDSELFKNSEGWYNYSTLQQEDVAVEDGSCPCRDALGYVGLPGEIKIIVV